MEILRIPIGQNQANCYLVYSKQTKDGIVIDPGGAGDRILDMVNERKINLKFIVLTHGHGDHIGGVEYIKDKIDIPIIIHRDEEELLKDPELNLSPMLGMGNISIEADELVDEGDIIEFGDLSAKIIHTPGHTKGGMSLLIGDSIFTGDTIFKGSIGRTDFPGGDYNTIIESINNKILSLDDRLVILSGHGDITDIETERNTNPFI